MTRLVVLKQKIKQSCKKIWEYLEAEEQYIPVEVKRDFLKVENVLVEKATDDDGIPVTNLLIPREIFVRNKKCLAEGNMVYAKVLRLFTKVMQVKK